MPEKKQVLLLTNRDSDNVGDQIIEASAISIVHAIMSNLGYAKEDYTIKSRAAGMITKRYMATLDEKLLESARKSISKADLIIFGGAPLFNYAYQVFYKRTIITLELAEEYGVPVLFSSIGVESFNAKNSKCLALKEALNLSCVRQITTRDDLESVQKYVEGTDIPYARVSDPAVLADIVFRKKSSSPKQATAHKETASEEFLRSSAKKATLLLPSSTVPFVKKARKTASRMLPKPVKDTLKQTPLRALAAKPKTHPSASTPIKAPKQNPTDSELPSTRKKRIGLVVTRRGIFKDNKIDFTAQKQRELWLDVIDLLNQKGYDYKLFTTGHFSDEVFLDEFVRENNIAPEKFSLPTNRPEDLIHNLRSCDGILAYRLHASITSYAFGIPSIGLTWNFKIPFFYESIGLGNRALTSDQWNAPTLIHAIEEAMDEGVEKDPQFLMSVYNTLFDGVKGVFQPDSDAQAYSLADLQTKMPQDPGTSYALYRERTARKMRRTYENFVKENSPFKRR